MKIKKKQLFNGRQYIINRYHRATFFIHTEPHFYCGDVYVSWNEVSTISEVDTPNIMHSASNFDPYLPYEGS